MTSTESHANKAREALAEALVLLKNGYSRGVCNRAYYAVFEAAHAMLSAQNIPRPKSHSGLNTQFNQHIVKTGLIDVETGRILSEIENARLIADYTGKSISEHQASETADMAERFVSVVESRLEKIMSGENDNHNQNLPSVP